MDSNPKTLKDVNTQYKRFWIYLVDNSPNEELSAISCNSDLPTKKE